MICSACQAPNDAAAGSCIACGQPLVAEPASPKPGAVFAGRYQILSVLGRGGMGMVYKAHDVRLDERDPDPEVREDAADDLDDVSEIVVKEAMIPLIAVLKDKDPAVRIKAADSLGEIGPLVAAAAEALRVALRDPEARVRKSATKALSTIGSVVGATLTSLERVPGEDENPSLRKATRTARSLIEKAGQ